MNASRSSRSRCIHVLCIVSLLLTSVPFTPVFTSPALAAEPLPSDRANAVDAIPQPLQTAAGAERVPLPSSPRALSAAEMAPRPAQPGPQLPRADMTAAVSLPVDPVPDAIAALTASSTDWVPLPGDPGQAPPASTAPLPSRDRVAAPTPPPPPAAAPTESPVSRAQSPTGGPAVYLPLVVNRRDSSTISIPPRGGTYTSPDGQVQVEFWPGAVEEPVRVLYERQPRTLPEGFIVDLGHFSLKAETVSDGTPVEIFGAPVEIRVRYDDTGLTTVLEQRLHLRYYDVQTGAWISLPCSPDLDNNVLTGWTTHFTDFALLVRDVSLHAMGAVGSPCDQEVLLAPLTGAGEVYASGSEPVAFDYYTGTEVLLTCAGTHADVSLEASGPDGSRDRSWTFSGSVEEEVADLFYAPVVGVPAEHEVSIEVRNDPPPATGSSAFYLKMTDTVPPVISNVTIWQDGEGGVLVAADVVDNCALAIVSLTYGSSSSSSSGGGGWISMARIGSHRYAAAVTLPRVGINSFTIHATDAADNVTAWSIKVPANYSGSYGKSVFKDSCPPGTCGTSGDPVNTASGNLTYHSEDLRVPGIGETDLVVARDYNSQSVPPQGNFTTAGMTPGAFGPGWTFPFDFRLELVDNLLLTGAKVHYPDGRTARFEDNGDGTFTAQSPGATDTLAQTAGGYVLTQKDLIAYHFDAAGRLVQVVDPNGNTQDLVYGTDGRLARVENNAGRWIALAYNGAGLITDITAPEGTHLTYAYTDGLLTAFTDVRGQTWGYGYSAEGWLEEIVTPKGHPAMRLQYDEWGKVVTQIEGATAERTFTYDDFEHRRTITDANGNPTTHTYDDLYRLTDVVDARGYSERYGYDDQDRRSYFQDKEGREWHFAYDARGNLIHERGPLDWERVWEYNAQDRLTLERDPSGHTTQYGYDSFGNPTVITNALGFTSTTRYDDRGLATGMVNFAGHAITNTYDLQGNLVAMEDSVGAVTGYAYDGLGRTTVMTNPRGFVSTYAYAGSSRLMTDRYGPLDTHVHSVYDPNGNLVAAVDPNGHTTTFAYDASENPVAETDPLGSTTVYTYGLMNHLVAMADAEGRVTTYDYDATYNLSAEHAPEGATTTYAYDGVGNLVDETDAEGRITHYVYDALDRMMTQVQNYIDGGPEDASTNVRTHYAYDPSGNLVQVTAPPDADKVTRLTHYAYDALNRMVAETHNYVPDAPPDDDTNVTTHYGYDAVGNMIRSVNGRGYTTTWRYDAVNRLITVTDALSQTTHYRYDLNGNRTTVVDSAGRVTHTEYDALDRQVTEVRNYVPGEPADAGTNVATDYVYDLAGNLRFVTDPRGVVTEFRYDAANRRVRQIQNLVAGEPADGETNVTTVYAYDGVGNLVQVLDPNGRPTTYAYDGLNRLTATTNPENHAVELRYDRVGNLVRQIDARGYATVFAYDALNRVTTVTDALGGITLSTYDAAGNRLTVTDANGHTTTTTYDGLFRVETVIDAEGYVTAFEYDPNGNRTALIDGNGHRTASTYDSLDRVATVTNAEGETTRYVYDAVGNQTDLVEPDGTVTHYAYDGLYRLAAVVLNHRPGVPGDDETNVTYRYTRDPNGNLVEMRLPPTAAGALRTTTYEYDALNRLALEADPLGHTWTYAYDGAGNLVREVDANGHTTTYAYYPDNQLQRTDYDDGTALTYTYDANNNPTTMIDALGTTTWVYDPLNRATRVDDALGRTLGAGYDAVGNRISVTYPVTGTVYYAYSANNWLHTVTDPVGYTTTYERDGVGQMVTTLNPNQTVAEAVYDDANRLESLTNRRTDGTVIAAFDYELNALGLRTQMVAAYGWRKPAVVTETYAYDPLRRLTGVTDSEGFAATYAYDAGGNRTRWWANDDQTTSTPRDGFTTTYTYDAADRLQEAVRVSGPPERTQRFVYGYDANGNRTQLNWPGPPGPNTQGLDYVYDREDRLVTVQAYQTNPQGHRVDREVTHLAYDGQGRRLVKTYDPKVGADGAKRTETTFDGLDPVVEYALWNGQREEVYRGAGAQLLTMRHFPAGTAGQSYWYHHDGRGSVAGLTKHQGQSTHNYRYDAYGQLLPAKGNWTTPHNAYTFGGKAWDAHLDSYEFGYRLYDPAAGLWLTQDPLRGQPQRPRTLHRYAYAFASPISYYDRYGMQGEGPDPGRVPTPPAPGPTPTLGPTPTPTPIRLPSSSPAAPSPQPAPTPTGAYGVECTSTWGAHYKGPGRHCVAGDRACQEHANRLYEQFGWFIRGEWSGDEIDTLWQAAELIELWFEEHGGDGRARMRGTFGEVKFKHAGLLWQLLGYHHVEGHTVYLIEGKYDRGIVVHEMGHVLDNSFDTEWAAIFGGGPADDMARALGASPEDCIARFDCSLVPMPSSPYREHQRYNTRTEKLVREDVYAMGGPAEDFAEAWRLVVDGRDRMTYEQRAQWLGDLTTGLVNQAPPFTVPPN